MKGVVLAAGKGTRLYPVTRIVPKPLLPIANRTTLFYVFDRLKELGITDICIVVGENEPKMRGALGDGKQLGVTLSYVRQTDPHGLAHAVSFAREFVDGDDFCLYLGDAIYDSNLAPFAQQFRETRPANLSLVKSVEDPRPFGVANTANGRIVKLVEKPQHPESNLVMAGLYFFGPQIWNVLPTLKPSARGEYEITDAIQALIDAGEVVVPGTFSGQWFDTGTLDSYLTTTQFLTGGKNLIAGSAKISGSLGEGVVVGDGATLECESIDDAVVLPGSQVKVSGSIHRSLIGGSVTVEGDLVGKILHGDYVPR